MLKLLITLPPCYHRRLVQQVRSGGPVVVQCIAVQWDIGVPLGPDNLYTTSSRGVSSAAVVGCCAIHLGCSQHLYFSTTTSCEIVQ